jgi:hypothetical protein
MALAGAREWALVMAAGSSRTSTCASASASESAGAAVVGLRPCASGRPVDDHQSGSTSEDGKGPAAGSAADGVCVSSDGRASWSVSVSGSGC